MKRLRTLGLVVGTLVFQLLPTSCTKPEAAKRQEAPKEAVKTAVPEVKPAGDSGWTPGLGELMSLQQMRHVKLWFAGEAANWKLAEYELDELKEGFDDVVRLHPTHKDSPVPIPEAVAKIIREPLSEVVKAIEAKDRSRFEKTFDAVTEGCNSCHRATNFGFNVVRRPVSNPYTNQSFAPPKP